MAELLLLLIGLCVLACMGLAYAQARDPLHPLMYLGPMMLYVYVVRPGLLIGSGEVQRFLTPGQIDFALLLFGAGIALFCCGVLAGGGKARGRVRFVVTPAMRPRLVGLGVLFGVLSWTSYSLCLYKGGGPFALYSHSKAFISTGLGGWVDELVNLSIPAAALLVLAWNGERRYRHYVAWAIVFAAPLLIHGVLGARRGPTFMILSAMLVAWYVRAKRRIPLWQVMTCFGLVCALVMFLVAHRRDIHLGADVNFSMAKFWERVVPSEVTIADDTVFMYGFVNGVQGAGKHYWGLRYAATYLVRPIPRQIWPTKYADLGLGWMTGRSDFAGISDQQWEQSLGWVPQHGSAVGFVGDLFLEFSWLGLPGCFLLGLFYGGLWARATRRGGVWTLVFILAAALSIYVPTQSVSAVFHRFLFMSVPAAFLWTMWIARDSRRRGVPSRAQLWALRQQMRLQQATPGTVAPGSR
jgi:oligosaccharide repeat unit polymerase